MAAERNQVVPQEMGGWKVVELTSDLSDWIPFFVFALPCYIAYNVSHLWHLTFCPLPLSLVSSRPSGLELLFLKR